MVIAEAFAGGLRAPKRVPLSVHSEEEFRLSSESSAIAGRFRPYPFQREILDCFTDPRYERLSWQKSARVGYTTCIKAAASYFISVEPCPIMIVQPTIQDAEGFSQEEIAPMIRDTPSLQDLIADPRARDSGNTVLRKIFPGGYLVLVGANSPRGFRRRNIRLLLFDEIDGYPVSAGTEGDPEKLGEKRTLDFSNRMIVKGSTPTTKDFSRIERSFLASDQRYYFVPCPDCGHQQTLRWAGMKWDKGDPSSVVYVCENCASCIPPSKKRWMVERGEWRPSRPEVRGHAGFHIWQAYSYNPKADWPNLVEEWEESHQDREKLKTFVNTVLGETFDEQQGEALDHEALYARREDYDAEELLPEGVLMATMAVDVQDNRLEVELAGWGVGEEKWTLGYHVLLGDPGDDELWDRLDELLESRWMHPLGIEIGVAITVIDSGGHHTDSVYRYVKPRQGRRVYAIKGSSTAGHPIAARSRGKSKAGSALYMVGTDSAKDLLSGRMKKTEHGPGFMHFPASLDEEYFLQLTAERPVPTYKKGVPVREWRVVPKGRRNEAFDLAVYGLAALRILRPNFTKIAENLEAAAEKAGEEFTGEEPAGKGGATRRRRVMKKGWDAKKW
jgi:phage terminase large subunit GpA-like protein